jgi:hypothetical protein
MGVFVVKRHEEAAGRHGGAERSDARDREQGRRTIGWRDAAVVRTMVRALYLVLRSHAETRPDRKSQYLFKPSCPPSHRSHARRSQSSSSHPCLSARVRRKPSCDAPPEVRLGARAGRIHRRRRDERGRAAQQARSEAQQTASLSSSPALPPCSRLCACRMRRRAGAWDGDVAGAGAVPRDAPCAPSHALAPHRDSRRSARWMNLRRRAVERRRTRRRGRRGRGEGRRPRTQWAPRCGPSTGRRVSIGSRAGVRRVERSGSWSSAGSKSKRRDWVVHTYPGYLS